jgi:hypothetical protein
MNRDEIIAKLQEVVKALGSLPTVKDEAARALVQDAIVALKGGHLEVPNPLQRVRGHEASLDHLRGPIGGTTGSIDMSLPGDVGIDPEGST